MDLELTDKYAIVTGASRGIGRAITEKFYEEGSHLLLIARDEEPLSDLKESLDRQGTSSVHTLSCDVASASAPDTIDRKLQEIFPHVDVLVNNAGATIRGGDTESNWRQSFELNVMAPLRIMETLRESLLKSEHASVINISSIFGREHGGPPQYQSSKAAQIALSNSYARNWASDGIRINNIAPGSIAFEGGSWGNRLVEDPEGMAEFIRNEIPGGRFGKPEEVADAVVWLASKRASWVIGSTIQVDGGQSRSAI